MSKKQRVYPKLGAIVLFLLALSALCFYIATQSTVTYPAGFAKALAAISTQGWKTYTNKTYGYQIQYPSDWSVAECLDGAQVQFAPTEDNAVSCDSPTDANFFITVSPQDDDAYNTNQARIAQQFTLNGQPATRYMDALVGQNGSDFSEIVGLQNKGNYYDLNFDKYLSNDLTAEKMLGTFTLTQ